VQKLISALPQSDICNVITNIGEVIADENDCGLIFSALGFLRPNGFDLALMADEARSDWEIRIVREAISDDWASLASKKLNAEQRRSLRDHLSLHITALRELAERRRLALQTAVANRLQRVTRADSATES
jgi:hypothetical protein